MDDEKDNLMFDFNINDENNMKKQMKKEHFYDPLLDEKDDEWARKNLGRFFLLNFFYIFCFLGRKKRNEIVLNCPYCFTALCYECQQ